MSIPNAHGWVQRESGRERRRVHRVAVHAERVQESADALDLGVGALAKRHALAVAFNSYSGVPGTFARAWFALALLRPAQWVLLAVWVLMLPRLVAACGSETPTTSLEGLVAMARCPWR